jgi:hypothetical protein
MKKTFIGVAIYRGEDLGVELSRYSKEGWRYYKLEPLRCLESKVKQYIVCLERAHYERYFYLSGEVGVAKTSTEYLENINSINRKMENCGLSLVYFHNAVQGVEHGHENKSVCLWEMNMEPFATEQLQKRAKKISQKIQDETEQPPSPELIEEIIDLDYVELKKQMGEDWDESLADNKPDINSVIDLLSPSPIATDFVEKVLWLVDGALMAESLPEGVV